MPYCYDYPRPAVATDIIVCTSQSPYQILLIQRKNPPFQNMWALPGGFMDENEQLYHTAIRELKEETGIENIELRFFGIYDAPHRDPRGRTIGIVYYTLVNNVIIQATAGDDAANLKWFYIDELPPLAFDHQQVINDFYKKILTYS